VIERQIGEVEVGPIGLGGAPWSFADPVDEGGSIRTIHAAIEAGVRLIDTARAYTTPDHESHNEALIARALANHPLRDEVLVATKGGHFRGDGSFPVDDRPTTLRAHAEDSLRFLGVERLGLYQLHHPDPQVPIEDSVGELENLRREGKIAMIGLSNVDPELHERAMAVAPISAVQNRLSILAPEQAAMARRCESLGQAFLAYSPLGGSRRAGSLSELVPALTAVAAGRGCSPQVVALAWVLAQSATAIAIVGATRPATILDSLEARSLALTADELEALAGRAWSETSGTR
jgi:aryl-alcohol dehydrogenase-like predicted oxidoreductase